MDISKDHEKRNIGQVHLHWHSSRFSQRLNSNQAGKSSSSLSDSNGELLGMAHLKKEKQRKN